MAKEIVNGVTNFYGAAGRFDHDFGVLKTEGSIKELVVNFTGANYSQVAFTLPAGARIVAAPLVEIVEAFVLGGTTPTINIGVSGSHGTNYFAEISETQAEAIGTYLSAAPAGTLATSAVPLAAAASIVVALDGTSPTITAAGACKVVVQYQVI
jgi:hypothetical protein